MRFRVFGAEIYISFWFFAVLVCFALLEREVFAVYFLLPMALHEAGHLAVMTAFGVAVREVRLTALGVGIHRDQSRLLSYGQEIAICLSGSAVNLLFAVCLRLFWFQSMRVMLLAAANIAIAVFNLAPIGDLDGGQAARLIAQQFFSPRTAWVISRACSFAVLSLLFGVIVFLIINRWPNPTLIVIFCYLTAQVIVRDQ